MRDDTLRNGLTVLRMPQDPGWAWRPGFQGGIALVVALILLAVITLIGLLAIRSTTLQQRMTANFYDREIAFQSAEAGLQAAETALQDNTAVIARDCGQASVTCYANPFVDPNLPAGSIQTVPTGTSSVDFTPGTNAAGQPQYVIENMGTWANTTNSTGFRNTANSTQYGAQGAYLSSIYYRITVRSANPATVGNRAVVTLQAMYRQ